MKASQPHYDSGKDYDLIDVALHYDLNFFRFNVLKYVIRAGKKTDDPLMDLLKAKDYIEREIKYIRECTNLDHTK
jgi:hypothetical protein